MVNSVNQSKTLKTLNSKSDYSTLSFVDLILRHYSFHLFSPPELVNIVKDRSLENATNLRLCTKETQCGKIKTITKDLKRWQRNFPKQNSCDLKVFYKLKTWYG